MEERSSPSASMVVSLFISVAPLIVTLGVFGLAVSCGAQGIVQDVIGGCFVLLENQHWIGDVVGMPLS